jgi:hypothetical protein
MSLSRSTIARLERAAAADDRVEIIRICGCGGHRVGPECSDPCQPLPPPTPRDVVICRSYARRGVV